MSFPVAASTRSRRLAWSRAGAANLASAAANLAAAGGNVAQLFSEACAVDSSTLISVAFVDCLLKFFISVRGSVLEMEKDVCYTKYLDVGFFTLSFTCRNLSLQPSKAQAQGK